MKPRSVARQIRGSWAMLLILLLSSTWATGQSQSAQGSDIQQLKEKLQQLEQAVQELKGEITAAEQAQETSVGNSAAPSASANGEVTASAPPNAAGRQGPHTSLDVYGFAMLDSGYDFGQTDPLWFDVVRPTKLPSFANEFGANGNTYFSVRQARFGVKTSTPTSLGDLKTQIEFELFGTGVDAGQTTFRLRHAYGELGPVLAGQTWSAFMDIDVFPNSLEYWGPPGMVFFRNLQIRWTPIRSDRTELALALERPGASADQGIYSDRIELQGIKPRFNLPDFSWHVRETRGWGYVQLAGIFRKIGWVDTNNDALNLSGTAFGWASEDENR